MVPFVFIISHNGQITIYIYIYFKYIYIYIYANHGLHDHLFPCNTHYRVLHHLPLHILGVKRTNESSNTGIRLKIGKANK